MDILQEIYYKWDENYGLGKRQLNRDLIKKDIKSKKLRDDFIEKIKDDNISKEEFKKAFDEVIDAEDDVSFDGQSLYFIEGFKEGVKFLLSCLD